MQLRLPVEPGGRSFLNRKDMEGNDVYKTITAAAEGEYSEKRSKFLAFIHPVHTVDEVKEQVEFYQKKYYDARHCCYAYMLGHERKDFRANDNGEPSGTAGKPILGQINSYGLTDVLIVVIRYFGGIKLGTSGLIQAYKAAAIEAIQAQAGIDIGDTLIGMHLAPVAVPVRSEHSMVGSAHVVMARTRAKYIGGARACYR